uniref:TraB domain-containing protein n=1 Tax=Arcella intermedia TaxID=1963864 RepID=A0A6B2LAU7_9EUKA
MDSSGENDGVDIDAALPGEPDGDSLEGSEGSLEQENPFKPTITELPPTVTILKSVVTGANVYIVGTAHVSRASVDEVKEVIRFLQPNNVFLELCHSRISLLTTSESHFDTPTLSLMQALQGVKKDGIFSAMLSYLYSGVKDKLKIVPGAEFRVAFREARNIPGCTITLGDRPIGITLKRTWGNLGLLEKLKLIYTFLKESRLDITEQDIENMKDTDLITSMLKELSKEFPNISRPLIYERDEYLSYTLRHCPGPTVVAVVGLGHVNGIKNCWESEINLKKLTEIPPEGWFTFKRIILTSLSLFIGFSSVFMYWVWSKL